MRVYLDDVRDCPEGWELARTTQEAIDLLRTGKVKEISLDHDLGLDGDAPNMENMNRNGTGYDVLCYIEEHMKDNAPFVHIHTMNASVWNTMNLVAIKINSRR